MDDLADFNRGVSAIKKAIVVALSDSGVKDPGLAVIKAGSKDVPESISFQIMANGCSVTESFTKLEVLDAATGVDQISVASRIRGIAARIAERLKR